MAISYIAILIYKIKFLEIEVINLETTIKKIIAIDKDAEKFRQNKKEEIKKEKEELNSRIKTIYLNKELEVKKFREEINKQFLEEAYKEAEVFRNKKEEEIAILREKFEDSKEKIIKEIMLDILDSSKEE